MNKSEKILLEDKAAGIVVGTTLAAFLGSIYLYSLGKRVGSVASAPPEDSAHLPADDSETDDSPKGKG